MLACNDQNSTYLQNYIKNTKYRLHNNHLQPFLRINSSNKKTTHHTIGYEN